MGQGALPPKQGLYDPRNEHDACGVGFVANIKGLKSRKIVEQGLEILERLTHRGAVGADPRAGDGAGILIQIPDSFFREVVRFDLPEAGAYAVGMIFLPRHDEARARAEAIISELIAGEGQTLIGWRDVPVDNEGLGYSVKPTEPVTRQVFIGRGDDCADQSAFERKLFVIRKQIEKQIRGLALPQGKSFYISSMSSRTITYKGMLLSDQVGKYYPWT